MVNIGDFPAKADWIEDRLPFEADSLLTFVFGLNFFISKVRLVAAVQLNRDQDHRSN